MGLTLCFWAASIYPFFFIFFLFFFLFFYFFTTVLPPTHLVTTVAASGYANRGLSSFDDPVMFLNFFSASSRSLTA